MRILVIGGTRFIGPPVIRRLHAQGHEVIAFHRGKSKAGLHTEIRYILGDRNNLSSFQNWFKDMKPDVVLDMIPITEQQAQSVVDVFNGVAKRVVAISSQDVYRAYGILLGTEKGTINNTPANEYAPLRQKFFPYRRETPREPHDPQKILDDYDKIPVEKVYMSNPKLPGTILRLPMVYGPGDYQHRLFEYLKRMDDKRPAIIMEESLARWRSSVGYVDNMADAIALAVTNDKARNRIYNVAEPDTPCLADWVKKIGQVAGWQGDVVIVARDRLPKTLIPDYNTDQHLVVDTARIRRELDYKESVSIDEALKLTIEWERVHPPERIPPEQFDYAAEDEVLKKWTG